MTFRSETSFRVDLQIHESALVTLAGGHNCWEMLLYYEISIA